MSEVNKRKSRWYTQCHPIARLLTERCKELDIPIVIIATVSDDGWQVEAMGNSPVEAENELEEVIAGHKYAVRYSAAGEIKSTKCEGRWDWCNAPTGDLWLDEQLQQAVNRSLHAFGNSPTESKRGPVHDATMAMIHSGAFGRLVTAEEVHRV